MTHPYRRSAAVQPPPAYAPEPRPNWRHEGPAAEVLKLPPPAPREAPKLKVNVRPGRDLRLLIEKVGRARVERELNVHRTTVLRWLEGTVKVPGHQHQVIRMLLGDLPGTEGRWKGWRFFDGLLLSPAGDAFAPGQVLSLVLLRQQLTAQRAEIERLQVRLAIAEQAVGTLAPAANDARAVG